MCGDVGSHAYAAPNRDRQMNILRNINLILVTLLSMAAGIPKIMRIPQEVSFFGDVGLGEISVVAFGLVQFAGGVLLLFPKTRIWGATLVAAMFFLSTVMLFLNGKLTFGFISVLPIVMAGFVIAEHARKQSRGSV